MKAKSIKRKLCSVSSIFSQHDTQGKEKDSIKYIAILDHKPKQSVHIPNALHPKKQTFMVSTKTTFT